MTFAAARGKILVALVHACWTIEDSPRYINAIDPQGRFHFYFRLRAIYLATGSKRSIHSARSLWCDTKAVASLPEEAIVERLLDVAFDYLLV